MPHYEICYRDEAGTLLGTHAAFCTGDKQARILAHAMRPAGTRQFEVWDGAKLVYERPETRRAATIQALRPQTTLKAAR